MPAGIAASSCPTPNCKKQKTKWSALNFCDTCIDEKLSLFLSNEDHTWLHFIRIGPVENGFCRAFCHPTHSKTKNTTSCGLRGLKGSGFCAQHAGYLYFLLQLDIQDGQGRREAIRPNRVAQQPPVRVIVKEEEESELVFSPSNSAASSYSAGTSDEEDEKSTDEEEGIFEEESQETETYDVVEAQRGRFYPAGRRSYAADRGSSSIEGVRQFASASPSRSSSAASSANNYHRRVPSPSSARGAVNVTSENGVCRTNTAVPPRAVQEERPPRNMRIDNEASGTYQCTYCPTRNVESHKCKQVPGYVSVFYSKGIFRPNNAKTQKLFNR